MNDSRLKLLRTTFAVNAAFSGLAGAALLLGAAPLFLVFGLSGPLPLALFGVLLLAFASQVWRALREPMDLRLAAAILAMDVGYVLASVVLLLAWPGVLSPLGRLFVALAADAVAVFVVLEYVGLRRARRKAASAA